MKSKMGTDDLASLNARLSMSSALGPIMSEWNELVVLRMCETVTFSLEPTAKAKQRCTIVEEERVPGGLAHTVRPRA